MQKHQVQALLMGGQACVFYGAAQFSKDVDLALLASEENFSRVLAALRELHAKRIAVPRFVRLCWRAATQFISDARAVRRTGKDRAYWAPLKAEFEGFRRAKREGLQQGGEQPQD